LDDSLHSLKEENTKLKERIKEIEESFIPLPLLASPLEIVEPTMPAVKIKGSSSLLTSTISYVENNITKIMEFIREVCEISKRMFYFGLRAHSFLEYLHVDVKNEEGFYLDAVVHFGIKFTKMSKIKRRGEDLPSPSQIK
jgi:hypothetical protein